MEIAFPFYWSPGSSSAEPGKRESPHNGYHGLEDDGRWIVSARACALRLAKLAPRRAHDLQLTILGAHVLGHVEARARRGYAAGRVQGCGRAGPPAGRRRQLDTVCFCEVTSIKTSMVQCIALLSPGPFFSARQPARWTPRVSSHLRGRGQGRTNHEKRPPFLEEVSSKAPCCPHLYRGVRLFARCGPSPARRGCVWRGRSNPSGRTCSRFSASRRGSHDPWCEHSGP